MNLFYSPMLGIPTTSSFFPEAYLKSLFRHFIVFLAPVLVCIVIPYLILVARTFRYETPLFPSLIFAILGAAIALPGFVCAIISFAQMIRIGNGTIMPWDASKKLVIAGLYRYVRNPMILSLLAILLGEAIAFGSNGIYIVAVIFFIINTLYFRLSEEPALERRFGEEYAEYKANVPRWMPRLKPWKAEGMGVERD